MGRAVKKVPKSGPEKIVQKECFWTPYSMHQLILGENGALLLLLSLADRAESCLACSAAFESAQPLFPPRTNWRILYILKTVSRVLVADDLL